MAKGRGGKLTAKQEAFAQAYVETGNASEAYRRAYNASRMAEKVVHVKASELLKNGKVTVRVEALQKKAAKRHDLTVHDLLDELEEARRIAISTMAPAAAVSATLGKAKMLGHLVERHQHTGKDGGPIETRQTIDASKLSTSALRELTMAFSHGDGVRADGKPQITLQ